MMNASDDIEKRLREAASDAAIRNRLKRARENPPSEAELAAWYAGTLPPEEARRVARRAALSEESSRFLAELEEDVQAASRQNAARWNGLTRLKEFFSTTFESLSSPRPALSLVGAAAALAIVLTFAVQFSNRAPSYPGAEYVVRSDVDLKGTEMIPGGRLITQVDPGWNLSRPRGEVRKIDWFLWQPVRDALQYSIELVDPEGKTLLLKDGVSRNSLRVPQSLSASLNAGNEYTWVLEARGQFGLVLVRGIGKFRVEPR